MAVQIEKQREVESFWNAKPCDSDRSRRAVGTKEYFLEIEGTRYGVQTHIPEVLGWLPWEGKRVLEIGTGVGTDARQIIARGAVYNGVNVDQGSTDLTKSAVGVFGLPGTVQQASATDLPFADGAFDVVYSFGVLHHIPDIDLAVVEIKRVLKPGGELLLMVYNRTSINYYLEIMFLRKLFRRILVLPGAVPVLAALGLPRETLEGHRKLCMTAGRMSNQEWLSRNTDGPENPYSRVYGRHEIEATLSGFKILRNEVRFFDYQHWGFVGRALPRGLREAIGRRWGWHRVVHAVKAAAAR
jgi:SAM-dependent methyltransferase